MADAGGARNECQSLCGRSYNGASCGPLVQVVATSLYLSTVKPFQVKQLSYVKTQVHVALAVDSVFVFVYCPRDSRVERCAGRMC